MLKSVPILPLACCVLMLLAGGVRAAQIFEDLPNTELVHDPSVRAVAMGGAMGAVFWGAGPDHWVNPALLGYVEGIHYEDVLERFPTITFSDGTSSFDVKLHNTARAVTIGYGGVGLALADRPLGGGVRLIGDFPGDRITDEVDSWSAAVSVARLIGTVGGLLNLREPGFTRYVDAAFGFRRKTFETQFGRDRPTTDWGLLAKVGVPLELHRVPIGIEASYGHSDLSTGSSHPERRSSVALHTTAGRLPDQTAGLPSWLRAGMEPLVSIGGGWNLNRASHHAWGAEVGLANVLFVRIGSNGGDLATHGWAVALPLGVFGGVRYEQAKVSSDFFGINRGWSAWIDPFAIARARR